MAAIDDLKTALEALKAAAVAAQGRAPAGGATEAQVQTAVDEVKAVTADVNTINT